MSKRYAFLFSGQGSQYIGMGKDIYDEYEYVREMFAKANEILDYKLEDIVFSENNLINQTKYTQISVLVVTCALYEVVKRELGLTPTVVSGFSLGEYSALYASGIFDFGDVVKLVNYRASFMEEAATKAKGAMAAILNLDKDTLMKICDSIGSVWIANYNSPNQLVISGLDEQVNKVIELVSSEYKGRAIKLNVSGAFHSPLMIDAAKNYQKVLKDFNPNRPNIPILMNYNAKELEFSNLENALTKQIYSPVYFSDTISNIINNYNVDKFIEVGPGRVLSGFVKKINREIETNNFENLNTIKEYKQWI